MLLVVCSHEFANGNPHLYSIHDRDRFRPLRVSQESIGMVLCTGLFQYARWLTVHIFDLISLPITCPDEEMMKEFFTFAKSTKKSFSSIAFDQVHEQNNKTIKGLSGSKRPAQHKK